MAGLSEPKPFLVTDSPQWAEAELRAYGRSIVEFRVLTREDDLRGIEGDVYTCFSRSSGRSFWALWEMLRLRVNVGVIRDAGMPPARAR